MTSLCLIGMPGVGKSKLGQTLASLAGYTFVDTDRVIRRKTGASLNGLFETLGSDGFLKLEDEALCEIVPSDSVIISPGGSSIFCERGMHHVGTFATILYLADSVQRIERRIPNLQTRGIVGLTDDGGLAAVHDQRDPLYRKWAHHVVWLPDGFPFNPSVKDVAEQLFRQYLKT